MANTPDYSKPLKNAKYERFCQEYIVDNNGKKAAIRAKYSKKTAEVQASQLLRILKVKGRVKYLQAKLSEKTGITAEMVIEEYAKIAMSNMNKYASFGPDGVVLKDSSELSDEDFALISEVSETRGKTGSRISFKLHSKTTALDALGRHLGIFEKDNTQRAFILEIK